MTRACGAPLSEEALLDYLGSELHPDAEAELEAHLFGCAACAARAERLAGLVASIAAAVSPVLSPARLDRLEREGRVERVNVMQPGEAAAVAYPSPGRLLLHRLRGPGLADADAIDLRVSSVDAGQDWVLERVPFDRDRGEVLVACQSHFADRFPRDIVFSVESAAPGRRRELARYTVHHREA